MKREVIQDFLNLPGIAGVALMDGRSRPYFCGVDQSLNFQQKGALAQGILQLVEIIPEGFEAFKFQFAGHQVHIYKLDRGMVLLVLMRGDQPHADYRKAFESLKAILQEDLSSAIATFRFIAGHTSPYGRNNRRQICLTSALRSAQAIGLPQLRLKHHPLNLVPLDLLIMVTYHRPATHRPQC